MKLKIAIFLNQTASASAIENQIQVFLKRCLRHVLRTRWPEVMSNAELWKPTNCEQLKVVIIRWGWSWFGNTLGLMDILREPPWTGIHRESD